MLVPQFAVKTSGEPTQPTNEPLFVAIFVGAVGCVTEITVDAVAGQPLALVAVAV